MVADHQVGWDQGRMTGDFCSWHLATVLECPLFGRYRAKPDVSEIAKRRD